MFDVNIYIVLACLFGLCMTWGIGANDLANIMSASMGSQSLKVWQALSIAILFEFAGAFLGSSHVSDTIRSGIIDPSFLNGTSDLLLFGMLAVLLAGSTWMLLASFLGMPVSVTNAIVGSLVGFGALIFGINAIHWEQVGYIAISWVSSPLIASVIAYHLLRSVQRLILETTEPAYYARRYFPLYLFIVGIVLTNMVVLKGLHHFHYDWGHNSLLLITIVCGSLIALLGMTFILRIPRNIPVDTRSQFDYVEKAFKVLVAFTTCAIVFAHGSNDVAIAVGPITAVFNITQGDFLQEGQIPSWIVWFATTGVIIGLMMYGRKVITTVGSNITALTPSRAFAATLSAATTVIVSTGTGIPVSATQTLVGAVLGVGLARGVGALNLVAIRNIFMSWLVTLPAASLLTIGYFFFFRMMFEH